jgi:biopolymer transport protein ExbD
MEYRYHPIYKYIAFFIILYAFLRHQKIMENNVLLINCFLITLFVMIVDQMFINDHLTIFQPLSDQNIKEEELRKSIEVEIKQKQISEEEQEQEIIKNIKKKKKNKKNKVQINNDEHAHNQLSAEQQHINLSNTSTYSDELYNNNEDTMYYTNYQNEPQQQRPERYYNDMTDGRGYDFQEPLLNNDYNFTVDAYNS